MKLSLKLHQGFTMIETLLFLGIVGIMSTTLVAVSIATQEARVRQRYVSEVEQRGAQLMDIMAKSIRKAETVVSPASNLTGSILNLGMNQNGEYPTIYAVSGGVLLLIQKDTVSKLLNDRASVTNFVVKNINGTAVNISFVMTTTVPTIPPRPYSRTYESTITLYPDDSENGGGCGGCSTPTCTSHVYRWNICESGTCTASTNAVSC